MLYASFSGNGNHVYAYSTNKNLYIFDKKTGKLESMLVVPNDKVEINGMTVSTSFNDLRETMVIYSFNNLFKLDS